VNRFGFSRPGDETASQRDAVAAWPTAEEQPATPRAGDTLFEIGVIVVLHLAFALAVLAILDAFGVR
jgi:hypothetical protein